MYLSEIYLENTGPISKCHVEFPFNEVDLSLSLLLVLMDLAKLFFSPILLMLLLSLLNKHSMIQSFPIVQVDYHIFESSTHEE